MEVLPIFLFSAFAVLVFILIFNKKSTDNVSLLLPEYLNEKPLIVKRAIKIKHSSLSSFGNGRANLIATQNRIVFQREQFGKTFTTALFLIGQNNHTPEGTGFFKRPIYNISKSDISCKSDLCIHYQHGIFTVPQSEMTSEELAAICENLVNNANV